MRDGQQVLLPRLKVLEAASVVASSTCAEWSGPSSSPVRVEAWRAAQAGHPDEELGRFIVTGLAKGLRIGHENSRVRGAGLPRDTRSHPDVVQRYLDEEGAAGTLQGPVEHFNEVHVSPLASSQSRAHRVCGGSYWICQRRAVEVLTTAFPRRPVWSSMCGSMRRCVAACDWEQERRWSS